MDLCGLAGTQRHGLFCVAQDVRLRHGLLRYDVNAGLQALQRSRSALTDFNRCGVGACNGLDRQHGAGHGSARLRIFFVNDHAGHSVVDCRDGVFAIAFGHIHIDALGRRVKTVSRRGRRFNEGPKAGGGILNMELSRFAGHIASNDLAIEVDTVTRTGQALQCACRSLFERDLARAACGLLRLVRFGFADRQLSRPIVVEERLILAVARDRKNRPLCARILHDGRFNALCFICFDLLQKLSILSRLFRKKIVNKAQV